MLKKFFTREWLLTTILVIAASGVMARLGIWQLDRLEQRRTFNARVIDQIDGAQVDINAHGLNKKLFDMEFRPALVEGEYMAGKYLLLSNQVHDNTLGYDLLTPLILPESGQILLINRGWIPADGITAEEIEAYAQSGKVKLEGVIRRTQTEPPLNVQPDAPLSPNEPFRVKWRLVNLAEIEKQIPDLETGIFFQVSPGIDANKLPLPEEINVEITEGPHLGYAIQWFIFAALILFGYPIFVRNQSQDVNNKVE